MPEPALAEQLARALEGEQTGLDEADRLARLLRDATMPARFEVSADETERALARLPRPSPAPHGRRWMLIPALAAVAVVAVAAFVLAGSRAPGVDVGAQAMAAISPPAPVLEVRMRQSTPGRSERLLRTQWVARDGSQSRARVVVNGAVVEDLLREPGGGVVEYQGSERRTVVAPSCRAIAGSCSDLVDPISFYRQQLRVGGAGHTETVEFRGRKAYRFSLPVQNLGSSSVRVEQVVTVDATSFLPRRIVWREQAPGSDLTTVDAVIDVLSVKRLGAAGAGRAFRVQAPAGTPIIHLDAAGRGPVGHPVLRRLTLPQARRQFPRAWWLGGRYQGLPVTGITAYRWPSARALRVDYGRLAIWSFARVIPPPLVEGQLLPAKLFSRHGVTERFFRAGNGRLVAERDRPGGSVAATGPESGKLNLFTAVEQVRRLAEGGG